MHLRQPWLDPFWMNLSSWRNEGLRSWITSRFTQGCNYENIHIFQWKVCGIFIKIFFTWFIIAMLWQEILIEHLTSVGSLISNHFYFFHCPKQPFFMQAVPKKGNTNQWFSGHKVTEQHIKQTVVMHLVIILIPGRGIRVECVSVTTNRLLVQM